MDPATWPSPHVTTSTLTSRYGMAVTAARDRVHARLTHRPGWLDHHGPPVIGAAEAIGRRGREAEVPVPQAPLGGWQSLRR